MKSIIFYNNITKHANILSLSLEENEFTDNIIYLLNRCGHLVFGTCDNFKLISEFHNHFLFPIDIHFTSAIYDFVYSWLICNEQVNKGEASLMSEIEKFEINYYNLCLLPRKFYKYILPKMIENKFHCSNYRLQDWNKEFKEFVDNFDYHYDSGLIKDIIE
jgi:hypothetical protein